jgi:hypothetical protein
VGIEFGDVGIELACRSIVAMLAVECGSNAGVIARVSVGSTVADLMPGPLPLLGTTTTEEQVVVDLVIRGRPVTVKNSRRRTLHADDNSAVGFVGPDVAAEAIRLPAKIGRPIVRAADILPVR